MNEHSLSVLEFDKICAFLSSFAVSGGGKKRCGALFPAHNRDDAGALLQETTEMRSIIDSCGRLALNGIHDITGPVHKSRVQNFYLEPEVLIKIRETLETAEIVKKFFSDSEDTCSHLFTITRSIIVLKELDIKIKQSISPQGEILDTAGPSLSEIRGRLKKLRRNIITTLDHMMQDDEIRHAFQDDFITLRNNRYVIPVRSDSKTTVPGVVHDQSQTKATFFVEPLSVVNLNNELQILRKEEYYEEIRILTELTDMVNHHGDDIVVDLDVLERVDVIHAKALFSKALGAVEPVVNTRGIIDLQQCRHPILLAGFVEDEPDDAQDEQDAEPAGHWEFNRTGVVPIDLVKQENTSTLIITGANAGGKTVAMKTLGLFVLMAQAGMHIPVRGKSSICVYETIFADIGDEQNIASSLSTFSAHMMQLKQIVENVKKSSLVLLDELGSGTDPSEGGSLAVAILDFLRQSGCFTVITTHLNILKTHAYTHDDVENVSVAFDPVTLRPSYGLVYGVPGISNALAIAKNIGIPRHILDTASQQIDRSDRKIVELIHGLETTHQQIMDEKKAYRELTALAQTYRKSAETLLETMQHKKERILTKFETEARKLLRESEDKLMKLIKDQKKRRLVRPDEDFARDKQARQDFETVKNRLSQKFPRQRQSAVPVETLEVGQRVHVAHLHKNGTVVSVNNQAKKAEVSVGTMRVKTTFQELEPARGEPKKQVPKTKTVTESAPSRQQTEGGGAAVNVIGMRVEEALPVVDKTIDDGILLGSDTVEIVHGRGTGRLMKAIHEHLKDHRSVKEFAPAEQSKGGIGVTIVTIK